MKYGKIENNKIIGTCMMQTGDFPDEIPDDAELFDFFIDGTLYPATEYAGKIPTVTEGGVEWIADPEEEARRLAVVDAQRRAAYAAESDPLFFKEQRGEVDAGTWAAKVAEIKARYPKISA